MAAFVLLFKEKKKWEEEEEFDKVNLQCLSHHSKLMALHISMDHSCKLGLWKVCKKKKKKKITQSK